MNPMNCPICGKPNGCAAETNPAPDDCWCFHERFPDALLDKVPAEWKGKACICRDCLAQAKAQANDNLK